MDFISITLIIQHLKPRENIKSKYRHEVPTKVPSCFLSRRVKNYSASDISLQSGQKGLTFTGKGLGSPKDSSPEKFPFFPAASSSLCLLILNGVDQIGCNTEVSSSPTFRFLGHNLDFPS